MPLGRPGRLPEARSHSWPPPKRRRSIPNKKPSQARSSTRPRKGELAATGEIPFGKYYGSVDATPLFIVLAGAYQERTDDLPFLQRLWPSIDDALAWMETFGDKDRDGFLEYGRGTPAGLRNQGWKDSEDGVFHADGSLVEGPIALCEVQGYAYAARLAAARIATRLGKVEAAKRLSEQAESLRKQFEPGSTTWMHPRLTPPDADGGRDDHTHRETTSAQPRSDRSSLSPRPSSSRLPCCVCNRLLVAALVHDSKLPDSDPNPRRLTDQYCTTLAAQARSESYPVSRRANQLTQATAPADSSALRTRPEVSRRSYNSSAPLHQLDVHAAPDHCGGPLQAAERDVVVRIEQPVHLRAARLQQRRHLRRDRGAAARTAPLEKEALVR